MRLAIVLLATATGCGGGGGSGSGGDGCPECSEDYTEMLGAFCDAMTRCPDAFYPIAYRNRRECVDIVAWASTCRLESDEINDVSHYRLERRIPEVDPEASQACIAWLEQASCEELAALEDEEEEASATPDAGMPARNPCLDAFRLPDSEDEDEDDGALVLGATEGERCDHRVSDTCAEGLYCPRPEFIEADGTETCSVCTPLPAQGERCVNFRCDQGLFCKRDDLSDSDSEGTCIPPQDNGAECLQDNECASGFCDRSSGGAGRCAEGGDVGDPCDAGSDCRTVLQCIDGACSEPLANGEPCALDQHCSSFECHDDGMCALPLGETCNYDHGDCRSGYCDQDERACAMPPDATGSCQSDADCSGGQCVANVCVEQCGSDDDCEDDDYCDWDSQRCQPKRAEGNACEDDEQCLSDYCNFDDECAIRPGIGDACSRSFECYPLGYCDGGRCTERHDPGQTCSALDSCKEPFLCRGGRCELINLSCEPASEGEMCANLQVCDESTYCDVQDELTCRTRKGEDESCIRTNECRDDLYCAVGGAMGLTCRPRKGEGAACEGDECTAGFFCVGERGERTCQQAPAGQPCDYETPCPDGYFCEDEACQPGRGEGADCHQHEQCTEDLYCDPIEGCVPRGREGEPCQSGSRLCAPGFYCDEGAGICRSNVGEGEPCGEESSHGPRCATGLTCIWDAQRSQRVCQQPLPLGESCGDASHCASGLCGDSGRCVSSDTCVAPE